MIIQFSSGVTGPEECNLAIKLLVDKLINQYGKENFSILSIHKSRFSNGYHSILFSTSIDLSDYNGTILWICESPIRKGCKRKNWYINCSIINEKEISEIPNNIEKECKISALHSGGHGGQNVNKVESGVRVQYKKYNIVCTESRSQILNKKLALKRLYTLLEFEKDDVLRDQNNDLWKNQNIIERGNPVKIFKGMQLKKIN